ncbi:small multi-drug export protein [Sporosarcina ureilytica]|uniref:DNA-binding protein n=1 Tax=Sporosarcina ureilytica TaxID=298596 RepID=A0A1D8JF14_9BACL|nr:small multi-drug export protein [Sporosarcina ureilytica]AOV07283.1 DNA-binding protein [Sporosarcina ureilytica]
MIEYLLVFLGAAIPWLEIALVIPLGIISGLSPFWVMVTAFTGNLLTVLLVIIGFQRVKEWVESRRKNSKKEPSKRTERGKRIWNKYGMPGVALLGPFVIGTHISAFIGLLFGANKANVTFWMVVSIALWTLVFGILTAMGFDFFVVRNASAN